MHRAVPVPIHFPKHLWRREFTGRKGKRTTLVETSSTSGHLRTILRARFADVHFPEAFSCCPILQNTLLVHVRIPKVLRGVYVAVTHQII